MSMFDDIPEWRLEQIYAAMEKRRREHIEKKTGKPLGQWGGKRPGAGRPRTRMSAEINLPINAVQKKILTEMGEGSLEMGILKLINENM